ncbi:MAG: LysM domain-containing protein [Desulfobulbaceae bacterium]|nr:LysM domain-containing protein [Desulfobulbaceae bacterium]
MKITRLLNRTFFLCLTLCFICAGCATKTPEPVEEKPVDYPEAVYEKGDEAVPAGYYVHTVKLPNESLSIIAKWFTGDLRNWELLAKHNPAINPNRIFLGDKIKIPRNVMIRQNPMTLQFVEDSQPKPKRRRSASPASSDPAEEAATPPADQPEPTAGEEPEEDEPFLFGPKDYTK